MTPDEVISRYMMKVLVDQSCLILCDPMDCSPPGSSVHGISQKEYWSGLPFHSPENFPDPGIEPGSPTLQADSLSSELPGKPKRERHTREIEIIDEKIYIVDRYLINIYSNKPIK